MVTTSQSAREIVAATPFDEALLPGARNVVRSCLGLTPGSALVLMAEPSHLAIGAALLRAATEAEAETVVYTVNAAQAAHERFVERICDRLRDADASLLVSSVDGLPSSFRRRVLVGGRPTRRHGHMVGVTEAMLQQGLRADYAEVSELGERLVRRLSQASVLRITCAAGTDVTVRLDRANRWRNESGLVAPGEWANLPGGEILTTPASVDGVVCPDGGAWLPRGGDVGRTSRMKLVFERGYLTRVDCKDADASGALLAAVEGAPNGRRVGQLGFGTNPAILTPIGALLQDLKMPGCHLALGETYAEHTGASWNASVEIPLLMRRPEVLVDDEAFMLRGRFVA